MESLNILKSLVSSGGVSGLETDLISDKSKELLKEYGEVVSSSLSNISVTVGEGEKHILLDAHIDCIGLIVTSIDKTGFLRVDRCGGVDRRILASTPVTVLGKKNIKGVITSTPPHLAKGDDNKSLESDTVAVDTGYTYDEIKELVNVADRIIFDSEFVALLNGRVSCAYLDNRIGMVVLLRVLELIKNDNLNCKVTVQFSSQEETTGSGAKTGAFEVDPDEAIVVDVSFGDAPNVSEIKCGKLGNGPMICYSPSLDFNMSDKLCKICEDNGFKYQNEICSGRTGTNADSITVSRKGVKTAVVSVPIRNMHTPCEVADMFDVEETAKLIAEYIRGI